ncbi:MAG: response regulator [Methylacidiphilales bacterium]|nr:response regulator [Candidatus Methylacidiphilales bacterium]
MSSNYDYKHFFVLYVDDEAQAGSNFKEYLSDVFDVKIATSGEEGWRMFSENPDRFAVVMTDQRMPGSSGVELLEKVKAARPRVIRILATAYSDLDAAIQAVNSGAIYKYITKPWDPPTLEITLKRGMEFFLVQRERDFLMKEKMSALQRLMMTDRLMSLGIFAAGLNHHLRNSLTAVKTFLDLAPFKLQSENLDLNHLRNPDYWRDFYNTVQGQISKINGLLLEIQDIPETPRLPLTDTVKINDLLKTVFAAKQPAFKEKNIESSFNPGSPVPDIQGNQQMLQRALDFLLHDEVINVNRGGHVTVSTESHKDTLGTAGVLITISDNGPDISAAHLTCIFDPFFVRRNLPEEYGLNLLASFFLIYHHSGSITVKPNPQGGVVFEIFIPEDPAKLPVRSDEHEFLERVFNTEKAWEKILLEA